MDLSSVQIVIAMKKLEYFALMELSAKLVSRLLIQRFNFLENA